MCMSMMGGFCWAAIAVAAEAKRRVTVSRGRFMSVFFGLGLVVVTGGLAWRLSQAASDGLSDTSQVTLKHATPAQEFVCCRIADAINRCHSLFGHNLASQQMGLD